MSLFYSLICLVFAAGVMITAVVEALIPEVRLGKHSHSGTVGVILGFAIMVVVDITLDKNF